MKTTTQNPLAAGQAAHTPPPYRTDGYLTGLTGPTTPSISGPTCGEFCDLVEWDKARESNTAFVSPRPKHTPLSVGEVTLAIAVGENHKANAEFIARACNSHAALVSALESLLSLADRRLPVEWRAGRNETGHPNNRARAALAAAKGQTA